MLLALAPQVLQLALAELDGAAGRRSDRAHAVLGHVPGVDAGVLQGPLRGGQGEAGHVVGLRHEPAGDVLLGDEPGHLAGQPGRVARGVEPGDRADARLARQCRLPVVLGAQTVGRGDAEAGHHGRRGHAMLLSGRARTIALWKPPKPLPTLRTTSVCFSRAVNGM